MLPFLNEGLVRKIRDVKEKIDKYYTIVIGCLWVLSTLWDIIRFQCYWSDYMLELYSCFFMVFMVLQFIIPAKIPNIITNMFGIIKTTFGRSIIMLVFSLLFLGDSHLFHKLCAIFLFIGGFCLLTLELIAPATQTLGGKFYPSENSSNPEEKNSRNDSIPATKLDDSQPEPEVLDNNPNDKKLPSMEDQIKGDNNFVF